MRMFGISELTVLVDEEDVAHLGVDTLVARTRRNVLSCQWEVLDQVTGKDQVERRDEVDKAEGEEQVGRRRSGRRRVRVRFYHILWDSES